jgi:hypothetical protein
MYIYIQYRFITTTTRIYIYIIPLDTRHFDCSKGYAILPSNILLFFPEPSDYGVLFYLLDSYIHFENTSFLGLMLINLIKRVLLDL